MAVIRLGLFTEPLSDLNLRPKEASKQDNDNLGLMPLVSRTLVNQGFSTLRPIFVCPKTYFSFFEGEICPCLIRQHFNSMSCKPGGHQIQSVAVRGSEAPSVGITLPSNSQNKAEQGHRHAFLSRLWSRSYLMLENPQLGCCMSTGGNNFPVGAWISTWTQSVPILLSVSGIKV